MRLAATALLSLAAFATGATVTTGAAEPLRLAATVWPPFTDVKDDRRVAVTLVHEALERAGVSATTEVVADGRLVPAIEEGAFDGSPALWKSPERERFLIFSEPYLHNRLVPVGRKGADVSATSFAELAGRSVGLVRGYAYGDAVDGASGVRFVTGDSIEANFRDLLLGKIDYLLIDELVARYVMREHPLHTVEHLAIGTAPLVERSLHLALRRDVEDAAAIVAAFDARLPEMLADGTVNRILGMPWIRADVDGDGSAEMILAGTHAGLQPPKNAYSILAAARLPEVYVGEGAPAARAPQEGPVRFYIGGELYDDWTAVPDRFKVALPMPTTDDPDAAPMFRIRW